MSWKPLLSSLQFVVIIAFIVIIIIIIIIISLLLLYYYYYYLLNPLQHRSAAVAGASQQPATLAAQLRLIACAIKSMEFGSAGTHTGTAHLKHCLNV